MKQLIFRIILIISLINATCISQTDSINHFLRSDLPDTSKIIRIQTYISASIKRKNIDLPEKFLLNAIKLSKTNIDQFIDLRILLTRFYLDIGQLDKAIEHGILTNKIARFNKNKEQVGQNLFFLATSYLMKGETEVSLKYAQQAAENLQNTKKVRIYAKSINLMGVAKMYTAKYLEAQEFLIESLHIQEKNNLFVDAADSYNNLAVIYGQLEDYTKALVYQKQALAKYQKVQSLRGIAFSTGNIGTMYHKLNQYDSAIYYLNKSYSIALETNNYQSTANALGNLSNLYFKIKLIDSAIAKVNQCRSLSSKNGFYLQYTQSTSELANYMYTQNELEKAEKFAAEALQIANENGFLKEIKDNSMILYKIHAKKGNYKAALNYHIDFFTALEKINKEQKDKEITKNAFAFEYGKKAAADSIKSIEEKKIVSVQLKQEKTQRFALYGGMIFILIFTGFVFNRFKISQKQKNIIEKQKHLVEEKQKEILDSIHYAQRIQKAHLPSDTYLTKIFGRLNK